MKVIFRLFLIFLIPVLNAQEPPPNMGFVRFMNLVDAGEGQTKLRINGKDIWEPGYRLGQKTGALPYANGTLKVIVTKEGCIEAEREVVVEKGRSQTIVAFAEEVFDKEGVSLGWGIKLARLGQHTPEKGLVVTFVSFCKEDALDLEIDEAQSNKQFTQTVYKRKTARLKLVDKGRVRASVTCNGERIGSIKVDGQGNYVAMIYEGDDGKRKMKVFFDPSFMISGG